MDKYRVYATGMSMGGFMSHYLALKLGNRIAAIASVTGSMYAGVYLSASPARAVPVMQIHGTADSTVPYNGNGAGIPIDTLVKFWVTNNGCNPTPVRTALPDVNTTDGSTVTHDVYTGGTAGATCELYKIEGGEHTWPGSPYIIGVTNQDFNASAEIWRFFRGYRLNQFVGITGAPKLSLGAVYPNPCSSFIKLSNGISGMVNVTDGTGKTVLSGTGPVMNVAHLPAGNYIVQYELNGQPHTEKLVKEY